MFGSEPSDYVLKSELATCCNGIGSVYLAKHKASNEFISIKKFKMDRAKLEENILIRVSQFAIELWHTHEDINWWNFTYFLGWNTNYAPIESSKYFVISFGIRK